jgi:hypothetical protein
MKRISSRYTFFLKRAFPVLWFGFLAIFVALLVAAPGTPLLLDLAAPALMAVVGFVLMKKLMWDLADEVLDGGDFLVVKHRGMEETIPLASIMNVNATMLVNPPRITLRLDAPGRFGNEVSFSPLRSFSLNPFARSAIADDLIVRVDAARLRRAAQKR